MARFPDNRFVLISTPDLGIPSYIKDYLAGAGCAFEEMDNLAEAMPLLDVLYMTRIQQERFSSREAYEQQKGIYAVSYTHLDVYKRQADRIDQRKDWNIWHSQRRMCRPCAKRRAWA